MVLHAALKDHWLDHYKSKLLKDLNMYSAPAPGSRRLPKSIRRQLEMIKAREGEPLNDQFEECPTATTTTKNEHVRDVIAQAPRSTGSRQRPPGWSMVDSRAKPVKRVVSSMTSKARSSPPQIPYDIRGCLSDTPDNRFVEDPKRSYFSFIGIRDSDITNATLYIHVQRPSVATEGEASLDELQVHIYKYLNQTHVILEPVALRKFKVSLGLSCFLALPLKQVRPSSFLKSDAIRYLQTQSNGPPSSARLRSRSMAVHRSNFGGSSMGSITFGQLRSVDQGRDQWPRRDQSNIGRP